MVATAQQTYWNRTNNLTLDEAITTTQEAVHNYHHNMDDKRITEFWKALANYRTGERPNSMFYIFIDMQNWNERPLKIQGDNKTYWRHNSGLEATFEADPKDTQNHLTGRYNGTSIRSLAADEELHDGFHPVNGVIVKPGAQFNWTKSLEEYDWTDYNEAAKAGIISTGTGHKAAYRASIDTGCVTLADSNNHDRPVLFVPHEQGVHIYAVDTTTDK